MCKLVLGKREILESLNMSTLITVISISHLRYLYYPPAKLVFLLLLYHMFFFKTPTQVPRCLLVL